MFYLGFAAVKLNTFQGNDTKHTGLASSRLGLSYQIYKTRYQTISKGIEFYFLTIKLGTCTQIIYIFFCFYIMIFHYSVKLNVFLSTYSQCCQIFNGRKTDPSRSWSEPKAGAACRLTSWVSVNWICLGFFAVIDPGLQFSQDSCKEALRVPMLA